MSFFERLRNEPESISFSDTMAVVTERYDYKPALFTNGGLRNEAGQNEGSCKLFAMAQLHELSEQDTLYCFGEYYRDDVLKHPNGDDHQNIRDFIKTGWSGVVFDVLPLTKKQ